MPITLIDLILSMIIVILANWVINRLCTRSVQLSLDRLYHILIDIRDEPTFRCKQDTEVVCDDECSTCALVTVTIVSHTHGEVEKYRTTYVPAQGADIITPTGLQLVVKKVTTRYSDIDSEDNPGMDTLVNAIVYCE